MIKPAGSSEQAALAVAGDDLARTHGVDFLIVALLGQC